MVIIVLALRKVVMTTPWVARIEGLIKLPLALRKTSLIIDDVAFSRSILVLITPLAK